MLTRFCVHTYIVISNDVTHTSGMNTATEGSVEPAFIRQRRKIEEMLKELGDTETGLTAERWLSFFQWWENEASQHQQ